MSGAFGVVLSSPAPFKGRGDRARRAWWEGDTVESVATTASGIAQTYRLSPPPTTASRRSPLPVNGAGEVLANLSELAA